MIEPKLYIGGVEADLIEAEPIVIDYLATEIKDPATRKVSSSRTITLAGSQNNDNIFKQLFVLGKDNNFVTFDPKLRVVAFLQIGASNILDGFFQLLEIRHTGNGHQYIGVLYSEGKSLFSEMGDSFIIGNPTSANDIDLDSNTTLNYWNYDSSNFSKTLINNFISSNREAQITVIDDGLSTTPSGVYTLPRESMRLALKMKHIWDRIFQKYGQTYSSTFINSNFFKSLVYLDTHKSVPTNSLFNAVQVGMNTNNDWYDSLFNIIKFNNKIYDLSNRYNPSSGLYTGLGLPRTFSAFSQLRVKARIRFLANYTIATQTIPITTQIQLQGPTGPLASGTSVTQNITVGGTYTSGQTVEFNLTGLDPSQYTIFYNFTVPSVGTGSTIRTQVNITAPPVTGAPLVEYEINVLPGSELSIKPTDPKILYGDVYPKSSVIANQHKQKDFVGDIIKMFNCYVLYDGINYIVEPRDTFYNLGTTLDWTDKVDRSTDFTLVPIGQLNWKQITFKAAVDKDYYSTKHNVDYNEVYGQQDVFNGNEFIKDTKDVTLKFTPPLSASTAIGYPKLQHIYTFNNNVREAIDGLPRYAYWAGWKEEGIVSFTLTGGAGPLSYSGYPYVGEFDDPNNPTLSVLFGPPKAIYYQSGSLVLIGTNDLYNRFYSNDLNNQVDLNAKLLRCKVKLSPFEINNLKLYDKVIIDGVLFLISKINGYNTSTQEPVEVELIQYES